MAAAKGPGICGHLKAFPVAGRDARAQKDGVEWSEDRGGDMVSTRIITGVGGLLLVNVVLFAVQLALDIAPPLI